MPCSRCWVVSHWEWSPWEHIQQLPHEMLNGTTTRSPGETAVTSGPVSSTTPIGSWPSTSPALRYGVMTS